jgi:mono/diheme cytochrome c family protein
MGRGWRPVIAGAIVVVAVFVLAQWPIFEPSSSTNAPAAGGVESGQEVFTRVCAGCHGEQAEGGTCPRLARSGLDAEQIADTIEQGSGIMPAGLVEGQEQADVVAYVESIATP